MSYVRWSGDPDLDRPVAVIAFEGWNDAGDAATAAVRWFMDRWDTETFAEIDPEEFFDFTSARPEVRFATGGERVIDWPVTRFAAGKIPGTGNDIVLVHGTEPHLRWRTFCTEVVDVLERLDVRLVVTLGALLADVAHTRPVNVVGTAEVEDGGEKLGLRPSTYEGPTGIVGVLRAMCAERAFASASLWAAVPAYVPAAPSPKATLALVERTAALLDVSVTTTDLEIATASYERQINELVADDEETAAYVAAIERRQDEQAEVDDAGLIEDIERYLRERES